MAVETNPYQPQKRGGVLHDVATTGGDMLRGGVKGGLKTFGYSFLGGLGLAALGVGAVVGAAILGAAMPIAATLLAVAGVGSAILGGVLTFNSVVLGGLGFGVGAVLGPSFARDRQAARQQEVNGVANAPSVQEQLQHQAHYNQQLRGSYSRLANEVNAQANAQAAQHGQVTSTFANYNNPDARGGHVARYEAGRGTQAEVGVTGQGRV
jgi:hypothetical protein